MSQNTTLDKLDSIIGALGGGLSDILDLFGGQSITLPLSATAAQTEALDEGIYDIWVDVDAYIKVSTTADNVTTSTGYLLRANNTIPILVRQGHKLGSILASGTGTLSIHRVG